MADKQDFVLNDGTSGNELTRNNHYVPQWYQKGFAVGSTQLHYLDMNPEQRTLPNGKIISFNERKTLPPSQCFFEYDLYTTFFGPFMSDLVERKLFGKIDDEGSRAVRAFIDGSELERHDRFMDFFNYIDAQKMRTPKGLNWLKDRYADLDQLHLMIEMQKVQKMHCTIWLEGVREIVSAEKSEIKFIVSDHPVTIYNYACPPGSTQCLYPNDPSIAFKASQTIFPLDKDHCLLLTNYEYASNPDLTDPITKRTNARNFADTLVHTGAFLRDRQLDEKQVQEINFVIKQRARRYLAAAEKEWLYPERNTNLSWQSVQQTLLPPSNKIYKFGGEMFVGFKDGRIHSQDAFGRTSKAHTDFEKVLPSKEPRPNDFCPCGQGRKYKRCCKDKESSQRPTWDVLSIRERNMMLYAGMSDILGFSKGKNWDDLRKELSDDQVKNIHKLYGALWPIDTDIISLLPKPDGHIRAVYTGVVDPRVITRYATGGTLYFDELIIQNPFLNPSGMNPEYSPVDHPSMYRQQTLKNIALFYKLYPFIQTGKINFIPNLSTFNRHLHSQLNDIAEQRHKEDFDIDEREIELFGQLNEEDHKRTLWGLSEDQQRQQIKHAMPKASEVLVDGVLKRWQEMRNDDPLALLQNDLFSNGGQMSIMNMAPGFEMALFLAKATGGFVFTDSPTRWKEMIRAQHTEGLVVTTQWNELIACIQQTDFPFNLDDEASISLLGTGKFGKMRQLWQNIFTAIQSTKPEDVKKISEQLKVQIVSATEAAQKDMSMLATSIPEDMNASYPFNARFACIVPNGGIESNNALRLLVTCGVDHHVKSVPMAIFAYIPDTPD
ncbi:DUF4238 domain-containing protein [Pedobacter sp. MC2016-24]|uniref:DUF4238 domain-containing protein n=1 Tax=Pedobacter sp. MC2016-24 TaxID=2780090 RepID=UPI001882C1CF|nr:DUF4238 domain-containing protein [Pedobacter sp. MC2016-24]MBE9599979.1 DUF4238 domain-containing protein [Pedobacter sp. MC2016-24]